MKKPAPSKPVSIRIDPETRASLDYLIGRTGLKDAQIFRSAIRVMREAEWVRETLSALEKKERAAEAAPKSARKTR
jgi:hypothetical protein